MSSETAVDLADTIKALRTQLTKAMEEGRGADLLFELSAINVEFEVTVTKDAGADGGVRFGVISFGAKGGTANTDKQRITLTMQPVVVNADGERQPARVRDVIGSEPA